MKLIIYSLLLLLAFFADAAPAQGTGSSVVVYNKTKAGSGDANAVGDYLTNQIGKGLQDQFPCVDWIDNESMKNILELERERQILGQEPNDEMMMNLANALGARYIIVVSATALPNGQTASFAKVIDSQTGQTVANETEPPASGDDALDNAEKTARKIMQDLANIFKEKCQPHWSGTITYSFKYQKQESKDTDDVPGALESNVTLQVSTSDSLENVIEVILQPMSKGTEGAKTMSLVSHRYQRRYEYSSTRSGTVICRPPNQQSYKSQTSGNAREIIDESGDNTQTLPVYIYIDKTTGQYEISVQFPALTAERREERSGSRSGCGTSQPYSDSSESDTSPEIEAYGASGNFKIYGKIDPSNPDVLIGSEVRGNLEDGQYLTKWNLRLVKPKTKK